MQEECHEIGSFVLPFVALAGSFLGITLSFFSEFCQGARNPYEVVRGRARFSGEIFLPPNLAKLTQNGLKIRLFEFIEKVGHFFY